MGAVDSTLLDAFLLGTHTDERGLVLLDVVGAVVIGQGMLVLRHAGARRRGKRKDERAVVKPCVKKDRINGAVG